MTIWKNKKSSYSTFAILVVAMTCASSLTIEFFPGFMSPDTLDQYRQVISKNQLNDGHPVLMVYLWRALLKVVDHPGVMLAFHQILYWSAIALFVCAVTRNISFRLTLLFFIGFCPPLVIQSLHLWKDIGMMGALAMATAALLTDIRKPHWSWLILGLIALFYATAVRHNAFVAALPLLAFLCHRIVSRSSLQKWRAACLTSLLVAVICLGQYGAMKAANSGVKHTYAIGTIVVWDMVAISLAKNKDLLPDYLIRYNKNEFMQQLSSTFNAEANYFSWKVVSPLPPEDLQGKLVKDWISLIIQHPIPYLKHRLHVFGTLLGIGRDEIYYPYHLEIDDNEFNFRFTSMTDEEAKRRFHFFEVVAGWVIYRP